MKRALPPVVFPVGLYDDGGSAYGDDLYFISNGASACKIGRTRNLPQRLANLQHASPTTLKVELTLVGMGWQERVWHAAFRHLRLRGEWFEYEPELSRAITAALEGGEWIATLEAPLEIMPDHQWRERIADLEEKAVDTLEQKEAA